MTCLTNRMNKNYVDIAKNLFMLYRIKIFKTTLNTIILYVISAIGYDPIAEIIIDKRTHFRMKSYRRCGPSWNGSYRRSYRGGGQLCILWNSRFGLNNCRRCLSGGGCSLLRGKKTQRRRCMNR